ncbi:MAG: hypothetical protein JW955_08585 [Sedimentisphaerales bacterium]|nr:hypothetical protein [Sedimentisphaerales bacterium]
MRPKDNVRPFIDRAAVSTNPTMDRAVLDAVLAAQEKATNKDSAVIRPVIRRMIMKTSIVKLGIAAAIIAVVGLGILEIFGTGGSGVAWADVAERFESVPFFHLTIYLGHENSEQAQKIEIWKSEAPLVRAHEGNKVLFATPVTGEADIFDMMGRTEGVVAFDRSTRKPVDPAGPAKMFLGLLCPQGRFSLDTLTNRIDPGEMTMGVMETADTPASQETIVFEASHKSTPERLSIWALRSSRLPVRLRFVDPRNDECADFVFDYSQKKPPAFFDPNAFASGREN